VGPRDAVLVTTLHADQALFGYDRGHRLIGSSRELDADDARTLRSVSDMAFDGKSGHYLTVLPLAGIDCQALILSWPAGPALRPGSVWSHVLLIPFAELDELSDISSLATAFRRPEPDLELERAQLKRRYSAPLDLRVSGQLPSPTDLDASVASAVVRATYSATSPAEVVVERPEVAEVVLLRMLDQQWPRLRRGFACRTRYRASPSNVAKFDVEVVERASTRHGTSAGHPEGWVDRLVVDLTTPDPAFRRQFHYFGPDGHHGRAEVPALVTVLTSLNSGASPTVVADLVTSGFPEPHAMMNLKVALVGRKHQPDDLVPRTWPSDEATRLSVLLSASPSAFDYITLEVRERLIAIWRTPSSYSPDPFGVVRMDDLDECQAELVVDAVSTAAPDRVIGNLLEYCRPMGIAVLRRRPEALTSPGFWSSGDNTDLLGVLAATDSGTRRAVFIALLRAQAVDAASDVCSWTPSLWWDAMDGVELPQTHAALIATASTLHDILARVGGASVGDASIATWTPEKLMLLALAADPDIGLWRQAPAQAWVRLAEAQPKPDSSVSGDEWRRLAIRIYSLALVSGIETRQPEVRKRAWLCAFPALHGMLLDRGEDAGCWAVLTRVLPPGPDWDRCERLRRGAIDEISRNEWSADEAEQLIRTAGEFAPRMRARLMDVRGARNRSWLDDILDLFR